MSRTPATRNHTADMQTQRLLSMLLAVISAGEEARVVNCCLQCDVSGRRAEAAAAAMRQCSHSSLTLVHME